MSGKSELKIFDIIRPQIDVESGVFEDIHPTTSLQDSQGNIDFTIAASSTDYLLLSETLLSVHIKITKSNGSRLESAKTPICSNHMLHALFRDISLSLNDVHIEGGGQNYAFKAAIEDTCFLDRPTKATKLYSGGYHLDKGLRTKWADMHTFELVGSLRLDLFSCIKYLIPGVTVKLRLIRNSSNFLLTAYKSHLASTGDDYWKIDIVKALIYVHRAKLNPITLAYHNSILDGSTAKYQYNRTNCHTFVIPTGATTYNHVNIFSKSILPKLIIVGMVKAEAYIGTVKHESLFFEHFNITRLQLFRDGQPVPYRRPYICNFPKNDYMEAYTRSMQQIIASLNTNLNNGITHSYFKDSGQCFFAFNLTPDFDTCQPQVIRDCNLRLYLQFEEAIKKPINVVVYGLFDAKLEIDKNLQIQRDAYS